MTTFIFSGIDDRQFNIIDENGTTIYTVQLPHTTNFLPMNAWDCCKDAFSPKLKVENPLLMSKINNGLFGVSSEGDWLSNWRQNLKLNFKDYMTATGNQEEEVVFERNNIKVERLNQIFFFNESGMGGARVAFDTFLEIDTGAQHIDEGPGNGNPNFPFPKQGSKLVFDESFFKLSLGFPNYILYWQCETGAPRNYSYEVQVTDQSITDQQKLSISNPVKNKLINDSKGVTQDNVDAVVFKELGDTMQTATYLAFIKIMESIPDKSNRDSYPINMPDDLFNYIVEKSEGNFKKLVYYLTIMLTSDNTVHYRNIKLSLPSCLTGSHEEKPYDNSTKTGRIFLPLTDPIEKLKSLLEMENTLVAKNNREIFQRLQTANLNKHLVYYKLARGRPRETEITANLNLSRIFDFITNLTRLSQLKKDTIVSRIDSLGNLIDEQTYSTIRDEIVGITEGEGFKSFFCPPFVIPLPPITNIQDPTSSPLNRKGCIISLPIINLTSQDEDGETLDLTVIIHETLLTAGINIDIMYGGMDPDGMDPDVRPPDPIYSEQLIPESKNKDSVVYRFSGSEKFLIYILSQLLVMDPENMSEDEYYQELYIYYSQCIYGLQYFKNIPFENYSVSDEEYAYFRLYRAILFVLKNINNDFEPSGTVLQTFTQEGINHLDDTGIDPSNTNNNPLFLEEYIDSNINYKLLQYFENLFSNISQYDDVTQTIDQSYLSIACSKRNSIITGKPIHGLGIQLKQGCISTNDIIKWLNTTYPGQNILSLPNTEFVNPYTKQQFSTDIIDFIRQQASPKRITRSTSYGGKKRKTKKNKKNTKYNKKKSKKKKKKKTKKKKK